jgi:mevalonate kinase
LIGEHAVTFGQPAIAIPFTSGKVKVLIESLEKGKISLNFNQQWLFNMFVFYKMCNK